MNVTEEKRWCELFILRCRTEDENMVWVEHWKQIKNNLNLWFDAFLTNNILRFIKRMHEI